MPVYEYRCQSCNKQFEYEHRMSEKRTECEACGGALERLISRTSFAFKGGGWYKDLYASAKPPSMSGDSTGAGASSAASTDTADTSSNSEKSASADKPASISTGSGDKSGGSSGTGGSSSGGSSGSSSGRSEEHTSELQSR